MRLYAPSKSCKYKFRMALWLLLSTRSVYANIIQTNQCAKLLEAKTQKPSFKDLVSARIRSRQAEHDLDLEKHRREEGLRKEEEERQKREAMDQANLYYKIQFLKISPRKFIMGEGRKAKEVEITKPYGIMDKRMTQLMYAKLMELMGYKKISLVFPSYYFGGDNSIMYNFKGKMIQMRPDDPVTDVSWDDINNRFIPKLNKLSKSEDLNIQSLLKKIIPDHQKGDVYDFVTEAQMENVMMLAKTADGDTIDAMILRNDHEKLKKYVVYDKNSNESIGTFPEASLLPLYIDGRPIYLHGNVDEWTKDHWDGEAPLIGGKDPVSTAGPGRSFRGGSWSNSSVFLRSSIRDFEGPWVRFRVLGFRLARVSRVGIHTNLGGTP